MSKPTFKIKRKEPTDNRTHYLYYFVLLTPKGTVNVRSDDYLKLETCQKAIEETVGFIAEAEIEEPEWLT